MAKLNKKQIKKQNMKKVRYSRNAGVTLVELSVTIGLVGILVVLSTALYKNVDSLTSKKDAELTALNESILLLNLIQKSFHTELIDEEQANSRTFSEPNKVSSELESGDGSTSSAVQKVSTDVTANDGSGVVELFTYRNECTKVPSSLRGKLPTFSPDYITEIITNEVQGSLSDDYGSFVDLNCLNYLESFQCGYNQVPFITFEQQQSGQRFSVPTQLGPRGSWRSIRSGPVAALICDTQTYKQDLRNIRDITVLTAVFVPEKRFNQNKKKRLKWFKQRMVLAPASPSGNVTYIQD